MATKKTSSAKKGKQASKPLRGAKHLERTKPLAVDAYLQINGLKGEA